MFTGIIEGLGTLSAIQTGSLSHRLTLRADFELAQTRIGDSIAVNGACLTAVRLDGNSFQADVSPETLSKTTFGMMKIGERVNLERALRLSDRLDGHLVSGHIDGMGRLESRERAGNAILLRFSVSKAVSVYMIPKGSVAVDGVSLTINDCNDESFQVSVIPHTAGITTLDGKRVGDRVNIETDLIGKYVHRFLSVQDKHEDKSGGISLDLLARSGFTG